MSLSRQVGKEHYDFRKYLDHSRFNAIYHQMRLIYELAPRNVLEIGVGANVLRSLVSQIAEYRSLDFDFELKPDMVAALPDLPIHDRHFDVVGCFQVLEHLPFDMLESCLREIGRISAKYVVISVPYARFRLQLAINAPRIKWRRLSITLPHFFRTHKFNGEHYWVVGPRGYSLKKVKAVLNRHFDIVQVSSPFEKQEHIFFTLRKRDVEL